jgi:signal transduction histidine kinase
MDESVTVDVSVPDDVTVIADDLLDEVVGNVLTNAVEHGGPGETTIRIRMEPAGETVTLRIEDDGPGVPDERKEAIFERGESESGGSGFGLYFVRTMMDAYRGSVHVRDNHPSGSVFVFEFPTATDSFG